jgi:hypothetical protein
VQRHHRHYCHRLCYFLPASTGSPAATRKCDSRVRRFGTTFHFLVQISSPAAGVMDSTIHFSCLWMVGIGSIVPLRVMRVVARAVCVWPTTSSTTMGEQRFRTPLCMPAMFCPYSHMVAVVAAAAAAVCRWCIFVELRVRLARANLEFVVLAWSLISRTYPVQRHLVMLDVDWW